MKVYRAETGQHIHWSNNLAKHIHTLDDFKQELEQCTGVPASEQILMTSFGTQVKQSQLKEVLQAAGRDEYIIFCYDRHYLGASPDEIATLLDVELPSLEPSIPPLAANTLLKDLKTSSKSISLSQHCELYLTLFAKFDSFSQTLMKTTLSHTILAKTLVEEQKSQSMALNVALTNLETHSSITNQGVQDFYMMAEKELDKQLALLDTADIDLNILRNIQVHPAIISRTTTSTMEASTSLKRKQSLADYLDMDQLETARRDTEELCKDLTQDIQFLRSVVVELQEYEGNLRHQIVKDHNLHSLDSMLMDIQETRDKGQFLRDKIKRDLNRIYSKIADILQVPISSLLANLTLDSSTTSTATSTTTTTSNTPTASIQRTATQSLSSHTSSIDNSVNTQQHSSLARRNSSSPSSHDTTPFPAHTKKTLEAFYHLAEIHVNDYLPKLTSYESTVRQHISKLIQMKRQSIQKFLKNMTTISQLQSDIAATSPHLDSASKALSDFKNKYGSSYLETSRDMLFAYGTLMIEVLRRKEYASILVENANLIADVLSRFREQEQDRRSQFRHDIIQTLPFSISNINDAAPQFEISTSNTSDSGPLISKKDVIDFVSLLDRSYSQAIGTRGKGATSRDKNDQHSLRGQLVGIAKDSYGQNLLNLLNNMNKQLDGLNNEFLKMIEATFLLDSGNTNAISRPTFLNNGHTASTSRLPADKALEIAEDKVKKYEDRISSLETTLQQYKNAPIPSNLTTNNHTALAQPTQQATLSVDVSPESSIYSVLDSSDEDVLAQGNTTKNNDTLSAETKSDTSLQQEIATLKETVKQREAFIGKMHEQLLREQQIHQEYYDQAEHDKEDMKIQLQEYEQLLEDERQAYEDNRKSFLKEAQIKDNLADIRIADVESDWKCKTKQLTETLEAEKQRNQDMESRHAQELRDLKEQHECELAKAKDQLTDMHQNEKWQLNQALENLRSEYMDYRQQTTVSKQEADEKLGQLVSEMNNSEEARNEIKQRLAQARDMVSRAENDWMEKHEALEKLNSIHDNACSTLLDLMAKLNADLVRPLYRQDNTDILSLLDIFAQEMDATMIDRKNTQEKIYALENNYDEACRHIEIMNEEKIELNSLSVHMAHKLDDIRKNVFFEVTNQLQLPVDENEVGAMTRKIMDADSGRQDDDPSIYNDILMATNVIDSAKFVSRIFKKVRNAHDLTRRWQKEYKELKDKYSKLTTSAHSKIAFRNFKVGDVALFLPTRNSSGKPWAAFNVNAPHYFLKPSDSISGQMNSREWIVARITSITECVANAQDPITNPYGLPDAVVFYQLEVENWRNSRQKHHQKKSKSASAATASSSSQITSPSAASSTVDLNDSEHPSLHQRRSTLPSINSSHHQTHRGIGLASISSSVIENPAHQSDDQRQHSSLHHSRGSSGNIVQSTAVSSSSPSSSSSPPPWSTDRPDTTPSSPGATDPFTV
ncbi:hypothetical protein [Absidia glauca]|uniref:Autophagy-related protein 11 n=1 Tax=Absidia glauca TaxID=4829 RepID=A0A168PGT6_ABSGL|nr:hypothetical protein [Absidia glauca]